MTNCQYCGSELAYSTATMCSTRCEKAFKLGFKNGVASQKIVSAIKYPEEHSPLTKTEEINKIYDRFYPNARELQTLPDNVFCDELFDRAFNLGEKSSAQKIVDKLKQSWKELPPALNYLSPKCQELSSVPSARHFQDGNEDCKPSEKVWCVCPCHSWNY